MTENRGDCGQEDLLRGHGEAVVVRAVDEHVGQTSVVQRELANARTEILEMVGEVGSETKSKATRVSNLIYIVV